ncbi:hypothetical protein KDK_22670 [Dictyobacter kobayashii]|uniref:Uncharacterized protein n=2 Tax=Dictyobacter kobayashii TaxID=2014872 RepID=A0A402AH87_9CHLR|nr:hypothetical protein KDK_22670 [Dictyobacter kobayashii]
MLPIGKITPSFSCFTSGMAPTNLPNSPLTVSFEIGANSNTQVDWQNSTFTVTFIGAQTFTRANLKANSSESVTVPMPSVFGSYQVQCMFNGTSLFNSAVTNSYSGPILVSANHQVGGIQLYTNPANLQPGASTTWNVVVLGAAGLPAPTGYIHIRIGNSYTSIVALGSGGTVTFQANAPSPLAPMITVFYGGDPVYANSSANFSLTNPSSPTNGGTPAQPTPTGGGTPAQPTPTGGGTMPQSSSTNGAGVVSTPGVSPTPTATHKATPTPVSTVTPTPAATATATAVSSISAESDTSAGSSGNQGSIVLWIVLAVVIGLAGAGAAGYILLLRKRKFAAMAQSSKNM